MKTKNQADSPYTSPLIDREIFFGNPEITAARLSPDGQWISFIKAYKGVLNIWIKKTKEAFDKAVPITHEKSRPIRSYFWTWDSRFIIYAQDLGGDENFSLFRIEPGHTKGKEIPEPMALTPEENTTSFVVSLPKSRPDKIYIGLNDRDKSWHDYYELDTATGNKKLILENTDKLNGLYFDLDGNIRFAGRSLSDGGNEILERVSDGSFEQIFRSSLEETISPLKFRHDGKAYFISNLGDTDLAGLYLYDPATRNLEFIESDPENQVDIENASFSSLTQELLATIYVGDKKRIYWKDDSFARDYSYLQNNFEGAEIAVSSTTADEKQWIIHVSSDTDPGSAYLFTRKGRKLDFLYRPRPKLSEYTLAEMQPVHFNSLDGLDIPAYLSLPPTENKKNLPAVIFVHGGPWARDYWGYNGYVQFLANRGYAVMQVNFRGSTGFGKAFLNAAINEWGEKMQDDLTAARHYLVENGIADPDRVAIMGGSYGGYATLAGLSFTPEIYAAGVSIVGPSNLFTLLDTIPPYWESARIMFHKRMGDPTTPEGRAQLRRQSPFFHADKIKAPLLVAQGANDPRVKKSESDQIVIAMRDHGLPVEYLNFPDEGHGFARPENNMAFIAVTEKFLARHIGGRYQEDIPEEHKEIIENARVDILHLEMPLIPTSDELSARMPSPGKTADSVELRYGVHIDIQGQEIRFELNRKIEVGAEYIDIEDRSGSAMHDMRDFTRIRRAQFKAEERHIDQGPMKIDLSVHKQQITVNVLAEGTEQQFNIALDEDFIVDGPMCDLYISMLAKPLDASAVIRVFNTQNQKLVHYTLSHSGEEINIRGYACHIFTLAPVDDPSNTSTYYVSTSEKALLVRKETRLKEMQGAVMRMDLIEPGEC